MAHGAHARTCYCSSLASYEHFYVLYCRYWELDSDHDGLIGREELLKYGGHRLSRAIVDRIFAVGDRPVASPAAGLVKGCRRAGAAAEELSQEARGGHDRSSMRWLFCKW